MYADDADVVGRERDQEIVEEGGPPPAEYQQKALWGTVELLAMESQPAPCCSGKVGLSLCW